ncbi:hypothetical protein [Methylosinus sp. KRF6]|uniref:hypothetical protein n=1 Tax=Methylosinus sp. KRF6 TaxID=2846853 RepID=UPI001C0C6959|nr:hypothetical protein [Methylosinus sp. KRF6]MBU3887350.1 hypothetical protein [Methylosinus sp. KRF6]
MLDFIDTRLVDRGDPQASRKSVTRHGDDETLIASEPRIANSASIQQFVTCRVAARRTA